MLNHSPGSSFKKRLIATLLSAAGNPPLRIILWDGCEVAPAGPTPRATLVVRDLQTLVRIALDPDLYFGDAYSAGRVELHGNLTELLTEGYRRLGSAKRRPWYHRVVSAHLRLLQRNTMRGSRRNIHHHYDLNTDFYRLWLDAGLVYTCAYFRGGSESIEAAQIAKMDHVCRKLRLRPGERVVEAGCGWGTLALHMARN